MKPNLLTVVGCGALLLSIVAPIALAHNQAPAAGDGDLMNDHMGGVGENRNGVSGMYVTSETGTSLAIDGSWFDSSTILQATTIDGVHVDNGGMLCDAEVLSDGDPSTTEDNDLDETIVDNDATTGEVPNGLWDDGGFGGACHTRHYLGSGYNTLGCPAANSHAGDVVSGGSVWIGAACDYGRMISTADAGLIYVLCLVNDGVLNGLSDEPGTIVGCTTTFLNCVTNVTGCATTPVFTCGPDSRSDAINFGSGGAGAAYPNAAFVASGCSMATAAAFVFHRVDVNVPTSSISGELPDVPTVTVLPATAGWISQAA